MSGNKKFDYWYAVNNTELLILPGRHLETFGNTIVNYTLVSEAMDAVGKVNVRSGRMQMMRPQLLTPGAYAKVVLEGFGEEARKYADWLREHDDEFQILRYGYQLKQEAFSKETVTDSLEAVAARVTEAAKKAPDPFAAVVKGVDEPWDVCLVKLFHAVVRASIRDNVREMAARRMFEREEGIPRPVREEIEQAFLAASLDRNRIKDLGALLQKHGVFDKYEERFFALVRGR